MSQRGPEIRADQRGGVRARAIAALRVEPRAVPAVRVWRTSLRTVHLIAVGALYGGHVYAVEAERLVPALLGVLASGGALLGLEVYRAPVWLVQVRGVATLAKLCLVAAVVLYWEIRVPLLTLAIVIGAVSSHMPGRWRYHSLLHGRVLGPKEKG